MDTILTDRAAIASFATRAYQAGAGHMQPIFQAAMAGRIAAMGLVGRGERFPRRRLRRLCLPIVLIIGDDDEVATGPGGWRCAKQATDWAAAAIVHGAGREAHHYALAVEGAIRFRRLLLVETASRFVAAWANLLPGKPRLAVLPREGMHPVEQRQAWTQ